MSRLEKTLCGACAALLRRGYSLEKISGGVDNKITCDECGRRRYGATYEVTRKKTDDQSNK